MNILRQHILRNGEFKFNSDAGLISFLSFSGLLIAMLQGLVTLVSLQYDYALLSFSVSAVCMLIYFLNYHRQLKTAKIILLLLIPVLSLYFTHYIGYLGSENYLFLGCVAGIYFFRNQKIYGRVVFVLSLLAFIASKIILREDRGNIVATDIEFYFSLANSAMTFLILFIIGKLLQRQQEMEVSDAEEVSSVRGRLLSVLSHDMMSPINNLQQITSEAARDHFTPEERSLVLGNVSDRLSDLGPVIQNTLLWTRRQMDGIQIASKEINVYTVIERNIDAFQERARKKDIDLRHHCREDLSVHADTDVLDITLRNLISNAIKHSYPGRGAVSVYTEESPTTVWISVEDEGQGIPLEKIDEIFTGKYSTPGTSMEKGNGVGLALVKEFLEDMGEEIEVVSEPGKGSRFIFSLTKQI